MTIPYARSLKIANIDALPRGTGARYLECIKGSDGLLIAKAWRRKPPASFAVLVDFA